MRLLDNLQFGPTLVGRTLDGIDVEDGVVYFDLEVQGQPETLEEFRIAPYFNLLPHSIVDIDGDMADIVDTPILEAEYDRDAFTYTVSSELGTVIFSANGPDTVFERC